MEDQREINADWKPSGGLHWYAVLVAFLTVVLLVAGALVTSNEAGDSVPDWPLSFGRWLIHSNDFVANVRYEYSHRFIAGIVGVATFILAVWAYLAERRKWLRNLALIALAGVVAQGLLGGVRVLLVNYIPMHVAKPLVAVPHALVAQGFFGLLVAIIVLTSRSWSAPKEVKTDAGGVSIRRLSTWAVAAVLIQLVLGAGFRHLAFGVLPHFIGAVVVTALIAWISITVLRRHAGNKYLTRPAVAALALVAVQVFLGVMAYIWRMAAAGDAIANAGQFFGSMTLASLEKFNELQPVEPAISLSAAHLVVGALTLATLIVLALRSHQALARRERAVEISKAATRGVRLAQ